MKCITLEEARRLLGQDTFIVLESDEAMARRTADGTQEQLWGFHLGTARLQRGDGKFHAADIGPHPKGYYLLRLIEEPNITPPEDGSHIIGHVIVEVNPDGYVRVRMMIGLNGETIELNPSSVTKDELDQSGRSPDGIFDTNLQRIVGSVAVYRHDV
jgi:hypothetical protein